MNLLELFCHVDDFTQAFERQAHTQPALPSTRNTRQRALSLQPSEIMTLLILFHQKRYRDFKAFYTQEALEHLRGEFPGLPSYHRFVEWMPRCVIPLTMYLFSLLGECTGISFVDSTAIRVCHNARIRSNRVFKGLAAHSRTSVDWFFGFKLHLIFNDQGEIVWFCLTPGNVDDRKGLLSMVENKFSKVFGKFVGDLGYLSKTLFEKLVREHDITLVTRLKKKMKTSKLQPVEDAWLLRKRCIAETIIDQLKNISRETSTRGIVAQ